MKTSQFYFSKGKWDFSSVNDPSITENNNLIFLYLDRFLIDEYPNIISDVRSQFPNSSVVTQTTCGNIKNNATITDEPIANLIHFEKSSFKPIKYSINIEDDLFLLGKKIVNDLASDDLKHILILSVGNDFNTSAIIDGVNEALENQNNITISGGIAGDDNRFEKTLVGLNDVVDDHCVVGIGLYGEHLNVKTSSIGGWKAFGPKRLVTKSNQNVLFEIDYQPAVDLYKKYLGEEYANQLPEAALLFPLELSRKDEDVSLVRTIISLDDDNNSMTFAGDIPEGSSIRLMRTNTDEIILAAGRSIDKVYSDDIEAVFIVSCAGRRWILNSRTDEELDEIKDRLPEETPIFGFYSYGEISMYGVTTCEVFNQTMTITALSEKM